MSALDRERVTFPRSRERHAQEIECPICRRPVLVDDLGVADQGVICWAAGHGDSPDLGARVIVAAAEALIILEAPDPN